jgi:beta-galactosidase/beta-glucuronidase
MQAIDTITLFTIFLIFSCTGETGLPFRQKISLAGEWQFAIDSVQNGKNEKWFGRSLPESVTLPGTLDENGKGILNNNKEETMRLSRERTYEGWAWYRKTVTIPSEWKGKRILLRMERTKPSEVWIDSLNVGKAYSILTPQFYDLTNLLTPGQHVITILIDNGQGSVPRGITGSHAWTEHTQTDWNGIIGEFCLEASNQDYI